MHRNITRTVFNAQKNVNTTTIITTFVKHAGIRQAVSKYWHKKKPIMHDNMRPFSNQSIASWI